MIPKMITVHCSATQATSDIGAAEIRKWHKDKGWSDIGYHAVIRRNGTVEAGRPEWKVGAHVAGHNTDNLGVCLVGGINSQGKAENNFTPEQMAALRQVLQGWMKKYSIPAVKVMGHRDWSPDKNGDGKITPNEFMKDCPCFDVRSWAAEQFPNAD